MKTSKVIALVLVTAATLLCSFSVFASTSPGKTVTSSVTVGDVSMRVSVHGVFSDNTASDTGYYYRHVYNVTLTNNTNTFQVADTNYFNIDLYSGTATAFTNSSSNPLAGWSSSVVEYSDNMTAPNVTFYGSGDYAGHVLVKFYDSDLLVLNPNEVRTYSFTIDYIQSPKTKAMLNGNVVFGYFTYTGDVSFYAKPESFTSQTIEDFINNDSLPNSAIAYYEYLLQQGIQDQILLDEIIDLLANVGNSYNISGETNVGTRSWTGINGINISPFSFYGYECVSYPELSDIDLDVINRYSNDINYDIDSIYKVPAYVYLNISNRTNKSYQSDNPLLFLNFVKHFSLSGCQYAGYDYEVLSNNNLVLRDIITNRLDISLDSDVIGNQVVVPQGFSGNIVVKINYYFYRSGYNIDTGFPVIVVDTGYPDGISISKSYFSTFTEYTSQNLFSSISKNFADIRDRLQSILDSYSSNQQAGSDVADASDDISTDVSDQHQQEQQYFSDTSDAIDDVGLSSYQFDQGTSSGLHGIKDDFTAVWNSCGSLSNVWIFSLTFSVALSIIRHVRLKHF